MVRVRRLAIAALMIVPLVTGGVFAQQKAGKDSVYEELNLFDEAFERIRQDAVDAVADTKLIGAAIAGMLSGLDPHSSFIDEAALKALQTPANDDLTGLGLMVTIDSGQLMGFIVDLRNNPGGSFEAAVAAADAFIDKGDIVIVKGRKPANVTRIAATAGDVAKGLPLVALVNGGTAREAELVAGAFQDN